MSVSIEQAAKDAVEGRNDGLWVLLTDLASEGEKYVMYNEDNPTVVALCFGLIRDSMSSDMRGLYGIDEA